MPRMQLLSGLDSMLLESIPKFDSPPEYFRKPTAELELIAREVAERLQAGASPAEILTKPRSVMSAAARISKN